MKKIILVVSILLIEYSCSENNTSTNKKTQILDKKVAIPSNENQLKNTSEKDSGENTSEKDPSENIDEKDPSENIDEKDPSENIDAKDPSENTSQKDPSENISQKDPSEHIDYTDEDLECYKKSKKFINFVKNTLFESQQSDLLEENKSMVALLEVYVSPEINELDGKIENDADPDEIAAAESVIDVIIDKLSSYDKFSSQTERFIKLVKLYNITKKTQKN